MPGVFMMNVSWVVSDGVLRLFMVLSLLMRVLFLLMSWSRRRMGSGNMRGHMVNDRSLVVDHCGVMGRHMVQSWAFLEERRNVVDGGRVVQHGGLVDHRRVVRRIMVHYRSVVHRGAVVNRSGMVNWGGMVHWHSVVKNGSLMDAGVVDRSVMNNSVMNWSTVVGMVVL